MLVGNISLKFRNITHFNILVFNFKGFLEEVVN
jgi:hypothetical protein